MPNTSRYLQRAVPLFNELELYAASLSRNWAKQLEFPSRETRFKGVILNWARPRPLAVDTHVASTAVQGRGVPEPEEDRPSLVHGPRTDWLDSLRWKDVGIRSEFLRRLSVLALPRFLARFKSRARKQDVHEDVMPAWAQRLDLARQWFGDDGALMIFDVVREHKDLHGVQGRLAQHFWGTILRAAIRSREEERIEQVMDYALWMLEKHDAMWPDLYLSLMNGLLEKRAFKNIRECHRTFTTMLSIKHGEEICTHPRSREYLPAALDMAALLQQFVLDSSGKMQRTLMTLYATQDQRGMYDHIIPLLFDNGLSHIARAWRRLLLDNGDRPAETCSSPSRPFLRFMHGFHKDVLLVREERVALGLEEAEVAEPEKDEDVPDASLLFMGLPGLVRRGAAIPGSDDMRCARYFATPSFSFKAIVSTLRIKELGPLSMQAIARREGDSGTIAKRLTELQAVGVNVGPSTYATFIKRLVDAGQDALLKDLLANDIHPDEFDKTQKMQRIIQYAVAQGDLRKYRLLTAVQLACADRATDSMLNHVLTRVLDQGRTRVVADLLDDMAALDARVSRSDTKPLVFRHFLHFDSPAWLALRTDPGLITNVLRISRRMAAMGWKPSADSWRDLLHRLGRLGHLDSLERVCAHVVDTYQTPEPGSGLVLINKRDTPSAQLHLSDGLAHTPLDIPVRLSDHPLRHIFCAGMVRAIVRWGFVNTVMAPRHFDAVQGRRVSPRDFDYARGVRLVRCLVDSGVDVPHVDVVVRGAVVALLARMYLGRIQPSRTRPYPELRRMRDVFHEAWGSPFLPDVSELKTLVAGNALRKVMDEHRRNGQRILDDDFDAQVMDVIEGRSASQPAFLQRRKPSPRRRPEQQQQQQQQPQ